MDKLENIFQLQDELNLRIGVNMKDMNDEDRKTKKAYSKKNSQKHEDNEINEKKSGLGNFLSRIFGK